MKNKILLNNNFLVLGFYDRANLGDETYKIVFTQYFQNYNLTYLCIDDINETTDVNNYAGILIGGGDIINNYFYGKYNKLIQNYKGIKLAVSIGIPFASLINEKYLKDFDHIFTRNYCDVREIQKIVGYDKAHYLPDLAFILNQPKFNLNIENNKKKTCGIFLINNLMKFTDILTDLTNLIYIISQEYDIVFYKFNSSNTVEDDFQVSEYVLALLRIKHNTCLSKINNYVDHTAYSTYDMLNVISKLDFAVCLRFHAHVFCMLANVPFLSISCTKKTKVLMTHAKLRNYQYNIKLNSDGTPIKSNSSDMIDIYKNTLENNNHQMMLINEYVTKCKFLLDSKQIENIIMQELIPLTENVTLFMKNNGHDYANVARLITKKTIGYSDSIFNWGIIDKLKKMSSSIYESIDYLINEKIEKLIHPNINNKLPLYIDLSEYQSYKDVHRGGWYVAIEELCKLTSSNGILCDMYVDRTFHWCSSYLSHCGIIPYTIPWCGFIHHTADTTQSTYNIINLFNNKLFIQSLETCVVLFTLSEPLTKIIKKFVNISGYNFAVITLMHPVVYPNYFFSMYNFNKNNNKKLIQIGCWLRNFFTIFTLNNNIINKNCNNTIEKYILIGKNMDECRIPDNLLIEHISEYYKLPIDEQNNANKGIIDEYSQHGKDIPCRGEHIICRGENVIIPRIIQHMINWLMKTYDVSIIYYNNILYISDENVKNLVKNMISNMNYIQFLENQEYDNLLHNNILFLHLIDVAACNVIIEAIVRNTPILINKIPGTVHLLGENYPLFYTEEHIKNNKIESVLTLINIERTHKYLNHLNKDKYKINYFINNIENIVKNI